MQANPAFTVWMSDTFLKIVLSTQNGHVVLKDAQTSIIANYTTILTQREELSSQLKNSYINKCWCHSRHVTLRMRMSTLQFVPPRLSSVMEESKNELWLRWIHVLTQRTLTLTLPKKWVWLWKRKELLEISIFWNPQLKSTQTSYHSCFLHWINLQRSRSRHTLSRI